MARLIEDLAAVSPIRTVKHPTLWHGISYGVLILLVVAAVSHLH